MINSVDKSTLRNLTLWGTINFKGAKLSIALTPESTNLSVMLCATVVGTAIIAISMSDSLTTLTIFSGL